MLGATAIVGTITAAKSFVAGKVAALGAKVGAFVGSVGASVINAEDTTSTSININFDPTQMFTYSNVIIDCMMPVVYITAGLSLGFTVIYALKSAFSSRF